MNLRRIALAAVVAWLVYMALGFVVHGILLKDTYLQYASVMRPEAEQNNHKLSEITVTFSWGVTII